MPPRCSICHHPDRETIDRALVSGESLRNIAEQYSVSSTALHRHKAHIPTAVATAHEAGEVAEADRLLSTVRDLLQSAVGTITQAENGGDLRTKLAAIREARETAKLLLEVYGELQTQPTFNIIMAPEWVEVRTVVLQALGPYPDARIAVAGALERVER
ncbi:MAG: hypothetical protein ABFC89_00635 [Methanospirillum sp.]